jgi:hypothetical protein
LITLDVEENEIRGENWDAVSGARPGDGYRRSSTYCMGSNVAHVKALLITLNYAKIKAGEDPAAERN